MKMVKEKYVEPELKLIRVMKEDVITASGGIGDELPPIKHSLDSELLGVEK